VQSYLFGPVDAWMSGRPALGERGRATHCPERPTRPPGHRHEPQFEATDRRCDIGPRARCAPCSAPSAPFAP